MDVQLEIGCVLVLSGLAISAPERHEFICYPYHFSIQDRSVILSQLSGGLRRSARMDGLRVEISRGASRSNARHKLRGQTIHTSSD
jgi:hypothetical protein